MTRRYDRESIEVVSDATGTPQSFRWRRRRYIVRAVLAHWVEARDWWHEAAGASGQRWCWRVESVSRTGEAGVYDLAMLRIGPVGSWSIDRVLD